MLQIYTKDKKIQKIKRILKRFSKKSKTLQKKNARILAVPKKKETKSYKRF